LAEDVFMNASDRQRFTTAHAAAPGTTYRLPRETSRQYGPKPPRVYKVKADCGREAKRNL